MDMTERLERLASARVNMKKRGIVVGDAITETTVKSELSYKEQIMLAKEAVVVATRLKNRLVEYENQRNN